LEAEQYRKNREGFDMVGIDYNDGPPWTVQPQIQAANEQLAFWDAWLKEAMR
jgi:hypothetical protein